MKKQFFLLMIFMVVLIFGRPMRADGKSDNIYDIPQGAIEYAQEIYMTLYKISVEDRNMGLEPSGEKVKLGTPFYIYDIKTKGKQLPVFEFPVLEGNECVLVVEISYVGGDWTGKISKTYSFELNQINFNKSFIAYQYGECTYFENNKEIIKMGDCEEIKKFYKLPFYEKVNIIQKNTKEYGKIPVNTLSGEENIVGYTPKLKYNTLEHVECDVGKYKKTQGNKPYCWAACVATTYNYYKGKQISTIDVVNKMKAKKKNMRTSDVLKAFQKYKFRFKNVYKDVPSLSNIRASLRNHYLLTAVLGTLDDDHIFLVDHDVIIYGTGIKDGKKCIRVFNPQGKGSTSWVIYNNVKTRFYNKWGWKSTYMDSRYIPR